MHKSAAHIRNMCDPQVFSSIPAETLVARVQMDYIYIRINIYMYIYSKSYLYIWELPGQVGECDMGHLDMVIHIYINICTYIYMYLVTLSQIYARVLDTSVCVESLR